LTDLARPASRIDGVRYGAVARHADERGAFRELWRASERASERADADRADADQGTAPPYVQANLSSSATHVLRGLHLHRRQQDHWLVASGRALVALVDVRPLLQADAAPDARPIVETRELVADEWVDIPEGVAHGFLALEPLDLIYLVTNEYDGSDELGFAWDDPLAAVPWPALDGRPILSDRDRSNPLLADLVATLRSADR
jgi:dTDP-4-dehydrorhamnose 3,5-epimerase